MLCRAPGSLFEDGLAATYVGLRNRHTIIGASSFHSQISLTFDIAQRIGAIVAMGVMQVLRFLDGVIVNPNARPIAVAANASVNEDQVLTDSVSYTYTPNANFNGSDSFRF